MRKSRFLTFLFGMIPGAGQMYLGYMKRGVSLMGAFAVVLTIAAFLNIPVLTFLLPVIWFYAFFDALNLRSLTFDTRCIQDDFLFHLDDLRRWDVIGFAQRRHLLVGCLCIFIGIYILLQNIIAPIFVRLFDIWVVSAIAQSLPTLALAVVIILFGLRLIRGDGYANYQEHLEDDLHQYRDPSDPNSDR